MLVSIVIATYKRSDSLEKALKSLVSQTYKEIEVILVDDNANDEWNKVVYKIANKYKKYLKITYIQNKTNNGSAVTRNVGIEKASGEYITFLDDDDLYLEKKIENQLNGMLEVDADFSVTDVKLFTEEDIFIEKRTRSYIEKTDKESLIKYHLMHHITCTDTMMFKKKYILQIGSFEPIDIGDEFYLMKKAIEYGGIFKYIEVCDVKAYMHNDLGGLSTGDIKINGENFLYEYKKEYFEQLDEKSIRYIKMRHYAVLAFVKLKSKNCLDGIKYSIISFSNCPKSFILLLLNLRRLDLRKYIKSKNR